TSALGILVTAWGVQNYEEVEHYVKRIEISFLGSASAQEVKSSPKTDAAAEPKDKDAKTVEVSEAAEKSNSFSDEQIAHLSKLNERKQQLDAKEEDLTRMEQELQNQKVELESRHKELEEVRRRISSVLEEKVKVDDKKVDTL